MTDLDDGDEHEAPRASPQRVGHPLLGADHDGQAVAVAALPPSCQDVVEGVGGLPHLQGGDRRHRYGIYLCTETTQGRQTRKEKKYRLNWLGEVGGGGEDNTRLQFMYAVYVAETEKEKDILL